ncbi:alpha/beta hydrolase [Streptacidiphilus sp. EB129]|uniref:alpha/beta hydrolase family protein n=1 Tax=Streptacidiphilus sp. EB129 TaxID=3156262 RepID=UPI0035111379
MPTLPVGVETRVERFREQRWVLDNVIRANGVTWDQGDMDFALFPCGIGALGDFLRVERNVKKYNDIAREYSAAAKHRQENAEAMDEQGYTVAARESYYIASVLYGQAQWPIADHTRQNHELEKRKNHCYAQYAKYADHIVRRAEIPYQGKALPGWLHLPPNYKPGEKLPVVITVGGMDSTKEICVALHGDQFLSRGIAVFLFDGPGQYSSALREIFITEAGFYEAGRAIFEWLGQQDEIDTEQIAVRGVSMGALWATQISTVIPTTKAVAIAYPSYEQGEYTAFQMNSPSFKLRFMFMAGYQDEADFDKFIPGISAAGLGESVACPYLVCSGEDDDWSSIESTFGVLNDVSTPKELLLYQGEGHTLHSRSSSYLGPNEFVYMADWIADRFKGKPMESVLSVVDATGRVHRQPWGENRNYDYGLPDLQ